MIKKFTNGDLQKCCELFIDVFNGSPWNDAWINETAYTYLQELTDNKRFFGYTLWDNGLMIGATFCHMKNHYKGDEIFIDEMFISPDFQRKGYGMKLMNEIETFAKANSCISITCLTGKGKPAFEFYEKFGCKHMEHLVFMHKRML